MEEIQQNINLQDKNGNTALHRVCETIRDHIYSVSNRNFENNSAIYLTKDGKDIFFCDWGNRVFRIKNYLVDNSNPHRKPGDPIWEIRSFAGHTKAIGSFCFSRDEKTMFSCSDDTTIMSWDVETQKSLVVFRGHSKSVNSSCLSPDEKTLFSCSDDRTCRSWDVKTGKPLVIFNGHIDGVTSICLSLDGKTLFSSSWYLVYVDTVIKSWNAETGEVIRDYQGHPSSIKLIRLSSDGKTLISCCQKDQIRSWNTETGEQLQIMEDHSVTSIRLSSDGKTLFSSSTNKIITSWDVARGIRINTFKGHARSVMAICLSPDEKTLFSCSGDSTIRGWDVESGECMMILKGHNQEVNSICLSSDGKILFSCSLDGTGNIWNVGSDLLIDILEKGADADLTNGRIETPLGILCKNKNIESMRILLKHIIKKRSTLKTIDSIIVSWIMDCLPRGSYKSILEMLLPCYICSRHINTVQNRNEYEIIKRHNILAGIKVLNEKFDKHATSGVEPSIFKIIKDFLS